jgi:signal transduction histidine kinase/ligand-binding sensor domain-containing protein
LVENKKSILLACTAGKGLLRLNTETGKTDAVQTALPDPGVLSHLNISSIALENNQLWLAVLGGGFKMLDLKTGLLKHLPIINEDDANATNIYIDHQQNIWTIDHTGLKIVDKSAGTLLGYYPETLNATNIKGNVKGIFEDRQGNYWVFHEPGGLGVSFLPKGFRHFNDNPLEFWRASGSNIVSMNEDQNGNLWLGFHEGGVDIFDWQQGKTIRYRHNEKDPSSLGRGTTTCIFRDSKGTMWVGSYFDGLQYFDRSKNQFVHIKNDPEDSTTIAGNDIRSIAEDSDGNLWLAVHGKGVDKLDRKTWKFSHYTKAGNKLSNNWTYQVFLDVNGNLWVGTTWGLNYLAKGETKFQSFISDLNDSSSLSNSVINSIYQDEKQRLWIGTGSGLDRFVPEGKKFRRYPSLFENTSIASILGDMDGNLWLSTHSGIIRFNPEKEEVKHFNRTDGLQSEEFNGRCAFKNGQNELFFGGNRGIDIFNPRTLVYNNTAPRVLIDKIKVLNKELTPLNSDKLEKIISHTEQIHLSYSDNFIILNFIALNFINSQNNQYAYILEGFEKNWHYVGTSREATYTNLDPGKYIFRVIASNNDGVWNSTGAALSIEILPPWYKTLLFKIFLIIAALSLVYGYITLRTSTLENQKHLLEKAVEDKTAELSEKNDLLKRHAGYLDENNRLLLERQNLLEQQSEELKNQSESLESANLELQKLIKTRDKIFSVIAHDLSSPFMSIIGFSELLLSRYNSLNDEEKQNYIRTINSSSERLHALLQNLLLWAQSQTRGISCHPALLPVRSLITEIIELRKESLYSKKIRLHINCAEETTAWADREMIKTVFRNLLSNAIKFTPQEGDIRFEAVNSGEMIQISFTNTGNVIPRDKIARILSSDSIQSEPGTDGESGSGLGLILCKDFIRRNKGKLDITSDATNGTRFTISLPLQP